MKNKLWMRKIKVTLTSMIPYENGKYGVMVFGDDATDPKFITSEVKLENPSITINGKTNYTIDIYGDKEDIDKITSVPVSIDIDGRGNGGAQTYTATIQKPNGVRSMSESEVKIVATFGEEKQKTFTPQKKPQPGKSPVTAII